jgi:N-acetyl-anhydromuramyl-L-alanine amidase AmpD
MEAKQTAVEWLLEQFANKGYVGLQDELQAKAIEKDQITAFAKLWEEKLLDGKIDSVDHLYNETYGK